MPQSVDGGPDPSGSKVAIGVVVLAARAGNAIVRVGLAPARVLGRSPFVAPALRAGERRATVAGDEVLERTLTELPERVVESDALGKAIDRALTSLEVERVVADTLQSRYAQDLAERVLASPELEHVIERVVASPAVRAGLTQQTVSYGEELRSALRARTRSADERLSRRPSAGYGGVASRAVALGVDLAAAFGIALAVGGIVGLLVALVDDLRPAWLLGGLVGSSWVLFAGLYFVFFWSATGQTPGLRLLGLRVRTARGGTPGPGRALVRYVGFLLAIVPCFLGFAPALFDARRRTLADWLAGTVVLDEPLTPPR